MLKNKDTTPNHFIFILHQNWPCSLIKPDFSLKTLADGTHPMIATQTLNFPLIVLNPCLKVELSLCN